MPGMLKDDISTILSEVTALLDWFDTEPVERLLGLLAACPAVHMAGAGRSGLLVRCAAMRLMHLGLRVHIPGDTLTPAIRRGDLLLVASGSGETGGLVAMARKAREHGAEVALVTANRASTLSLLADPAVILEAPTPKAGVIAAVASTQPMGSLFEQGMFLFFEAIVLELMRRSGQSSADMFARHANLE